MVDIVLKLVNTEVEVGATANTVHDSVIFRVFAPATSKIAVLDESNVELGSMTIPGGFVEIITKQSTHKVTATPSVLCTPVAWR